MDGVTMDGVFAGSFLDQLRCFTLTGAATEETEQGGLRYFVNEFWTAAQRRAHSLHEVSYRACFKPQLPAFFIDRLTPPGGTVYDPFSGRGTTALQAALMGRRPVASDVNPLSRMLLAPRLAPPSLAAVGARLAELNLAARHANMSREDLAVFYHPDTLRQILALRAYLLDRAATGALDAVDDWIRMVAINRLTGHSTGFFSVYTLPPNQAVSVDAQRKINEARVQAPPLRDVAAIILKKSARLLAGGAPPPHPEPSLATGPAHEVAGRLAEASVDLIVTSPPFLDVVDYEGDNWLRCWFAGIDIGAVRIDRHRNPVAWQAFVRACFVAFAQAVRPGGTVAFEVGEVRGGTLRLEGLVAEAIAGLPFLVMGVMVNAQAFTKTANCWGVSNNSAGTNTNRILLAQRI